MPVEFTINDTTSGHLYVRRHDDKIAFSTKDSGECWASVDDVRKLVRELNEMANAIEDEVA